MPREKDIFGLCAHNLASLELDNNLCGRVLRIPVKKRNYVPVEKTGMPTSESWRNDGQLQTGAEGAYIADSTLNRAVLFSSASDGRAPEHCINYFDQTDGTLKYV